VPSAVEEIVEATDPCDAPRSEWSGVGLLHAEASTRLIAKVKVSERNSRGLAVFFIVGSTS